ncbi:hypothetical protein [Thiohalocapsa sp. ML1]|uniref:hypothetical protein n=1 Tax=Thiohalocapsa sp. ML1 TaxID=1431688 RepID=UPI0007323366|nr:hypothetical protein [Thiohalocapsa sp. ML1]
MAFRWSAPRTLADSGQQLGPIVQSSRIDGGRKLRGRVVAGQMAADAGGTEDSVDALLGKASDADVRWPTDVGVPGRLTYHAGIEI